METDNNKTIIAEFYKCVVRYRNSSVINKYVHENYIQHSPMGRDGRDGLVDMVEFLKTLPKPEVNVSPIKRMVAEGNLVVVHLELEFMDKHVRLIELFRLEDGMAAEHWDVTDDEPGNKKPFIQISPNTVVCDRRAFIEDLYLGNSVTIHRVISEGDLIAVHAEADNVGGRLALFDIFYFEDDRLADHWWVKQTIPEKMMHQNGMF